MNPITEQLERVQERSRRLLLAHRLGQWLCLVLLIAVSLAVIDYVLELPAVVRLVLGLAGLGLALAWLVSRLAPAVGFRPPLADLALRAERLYPQLAGRFASAVEFSAQPAGSDVAGQTRSQSMTHSTLTQTRQQLEGLDLGQLLNPSKTRRSGIAAGVALLGMALLFLLVPQAAATATARWFAPFSGAAWPKQVRVVNRTPTTATGREDRLAVHPVDAPLKLQAQVEKGHYPQMRVTARYRIIRNRTPGPWQEKLLTAQSTDAGDSYERLIDLPRSLTGLLSGDNPGSARVEFYFLAGDDQSKRHTLELAARPTITAVTADITPPRYAIGLRQTKSVNLQDPSGEVATTTALKGSQVKLTVQINKPIPANQAKNPSTGSLAQFAPGLAEVDHLRVKPATSGKTLRRVTFAFPLHKSIQTSLHITDARGLENSAENACRIEATDDEPPSASLSAPAADRSILPTAVVELTAMGRDDIGLKELRLDLNAPKPSEAQTESDGEQGPTQSEGQGDGEGGDHGRRQAAGRQNGASTKAEANRTTRTLERRTGRQKTLSVNHELDLSPLQLEAGNTLRITAVAKDVFRLDDQTHDPVRSAPRTLKIIDRGQLISRIRGGLDDIRRQAIRLERRQEQTQQRTKAQDRSAKALQGEQAQLTRRINAQRDALQTLKDQARQNRLDSEELNQLMDRAGQQLDTASQRSEEAGQKLNNAKTSDQSKPNPQTAKSPNPQTTQSPDDQTSQSPNDEPGQTKPTPENKAESKTPAQSPRQDAAAKQGQVRQKLNELAKTLNQGGSALELKAQLARMAAEQADLNQKTRQTFARTAGQNPEDLPESIKKKLEDLHRRQRELSKDAKQFTDQARNASDQLKDNARTDRERAAADALDQAADLAKRRGLSPDMKKAAQSIKENQLSQAGSRQNQAQQTLSQMSQAMGSQKQKRQQMLRRRLAKLSQLLQKLIDQQKTQLKSLKEVNEARVAEKLPALAPPENALRQRTMGAEQSAQSNEKTAAVAKVINQAINAQSDSVRGLRQAKRVDARLGEKTAVDHLTKALEEVGKQQAKQKQAQSREKRAQLRKQYAKLAKRQQALRKKIVPLAKAQPPTRRDQAHMRTAGTDQRDIGEKARKLGEKAAKTLVFKRMHERLAAAIERAGRTLRASKANQTVLADQHRAAVLLQAMARSLEPAKNDSDFEKGAGSGQGGGGGGGQKPKLIPDIAEIKLLRSVQQSLYEQTRSLSNEIEGKPSSESRSRLEDLGRRQRELHELGNELLQKVKQSMQAGPSPQ